MAPLIKLADGFLDGSARPRRIIDYNAAALGVTEGVTSVAAGANLDLGDIDILGAQRLALYWYLTGVGASTPTIRYKLIHPDGSVFPNAAAYLVYLVSYPMAGAGSMYSQSVMDLTTAKGRFFSTWVGVSASSGDMAAEGGVGPFYKLRLNILNTGAAAFTIDKLKAILS